MTEVAKIPLNEFYLYRYMCQWTHNWFITRLMVLCYFLQYMFFIPSLLTAFVIIRVKSSEDILQGISKLDYLLKVSIFQIYKDPKKEEIKQSIVTEMDLLSGEERFERDS